MTDKSNVKVSFGEQSKGFTADVSVVATEEVSQEALNDMATKSLLTAKETFELASEYSSLKTYEKNETRK